METIIVRNYPDPNILDQKDERGHKECDGSGVCREHCYKEILQKTEYRIKTLVWYCYVRGLIIHFKNPYYKLGGE